MPNLSTEQARYFRNALRDARAVTLRDAEAFTEIVITIERLASVLQPHSSGFGKSRDPISQLVRMSPFAAAAQADKHRLHTPFDALYELVRLGRNASVHEGAFARHLAHRSIELALLIEDALSMDMNQIGHFMVTGVVTVSGWQPVSFARQTLLANSFSCLPIWIERPEGESWFLISDRALAVFLAGSRDHQERKRRLALSLQEAIASEGLSLDKPFDCEPSYPARDALDQVSRPAHSRSWSAA